MALRTILHVKHYDYQQRVTKLSPPPLNQRDPSRSSDERPLTAAEDRAHTMTKATKTMPSPRNQRDAADQLAAAIAVSQQEACVLPQQHPSRPKRERRAARPLTYPADQTHSSKTVMARDKKNVERYFERMQKKERMQQEEDGPAACAAPPVEVEPTPAEEPKAKKQARPSKRTSEVQKIAETPAEVPEPVLFAEVVCSEVMTMAQKVSGKRGDGPSSIRSMTNTIVHHR